MKKLAKNYVNIREDKFCRKIIRLNHHADDYECMWNGIEDICIHNTGEKLPPNFFFSLSSFGAFCYMKTPKSDIKRIVVLGDGRTKHMYRFLAPIVGFEYKHYEYKKFEQAIKKAKAEIDVGYPPVLGALDMYYHKYYPKLYHKEHIPFHYVLMIGYDDDAQCIYLYDCGREEIQTLTYEELRYAQDCGYPGLSKPNTICSIRMKTTKNKYQIAREALAKRCEMYFNPPVSFVGRKGFEKFIHDLPKWEYELTKEEYDKVLINMVMLFGSVPTVPNALRGINEPDSINYCGGFDKMSRILEELGNEYNNKNWLKASKRFAEGTTAICEIKDVIVAYLMGEQDKAVELPELFSNIMEILSDGFALLDL